MLVTPLQMARYVAALGNGGYLVTPHLSGEAPDPVRLEGISDATLDIVRRAMYRVVHGENGTGKRARIAGIELAGKSGTAQGPRADDDAWFVAFAPYEDPEIAVAVVVEGGGGGGSNAGPVARAVIEAYLADQAKGRAMAVSADTDGIGGS
jgi:penicillin-binding protein 2